MSHDLEEQIQAKIRELVLARHEAITSHKLAEEEALVATTATTEALKEITVVPDQEIDLIAQSVRAAFSNPEDFKPAKRPGLMGMLQNQIEKDREESRAFWNWFVNGVKKRGRGFQIPLVVFPGITLLVMVTELLSGNLTYDFIILGITFSTILGVIWLSINPDNKKK